MALMFIGYFLFLVLAMFVFFIFEEFVSNYFDWVVFIDDID